VTLRLDDLLGMGMGVGQSVAIAVVRQRPTVEAVLDAEVDVIGWIT